MVPTIGNNDAIRHNQFPEDLDLAEDYYGFLYTLWFEEHPANRKFLGTTGLEKFKSGGYYSVEIEDTLFISLNTLYWCVSSKDLDHHGIDIEQMEWFENELETHPDRHIVINFHFFPGVFIEKETIIDLEEQYIIEFDRIVLKYSDRIALITGAHTHFGTIKAGEF